jgi:hypothetical protein
MTLAGMVISIEVVDVIARDPDLPIGIIDHEVTAVSEMSVMIGMIERAVSHEIRVDQETRNAARVEAPSRRKRELHL